MSLSIKKKNILNNLNLTKKYYLLKKINNNISTLKNLLVTDHDYKNLSLLLNKHPTKNVKNFFLSYIISFSFSPKNTLLHITDVWGNLKFRYSAGLVGISGKQKKNRVLVLSRLFNKLTKIKITVLKNKPIALHLNNVGYYKNFIVKKLKKDFFIKIVKSYETYPYNGCRKKKRLHKRQRSKK
uniref:ribosomal protein S11 n=1 Tax=Haslea pseudostrearia TaxID=197756 RepID=UPI0021FE3DC0